MQRSERGWFKSTYSTLATQGCVEVMFAASQVLLRHSRAPFGPALIFTPTEWEAFLLGVADGEFILPRS